MYRHECPFCGGGLRVVAFLATTSIPLGPDGFATADADFMNTSSEIVQCPDCFARGPLTDADEPHGMRPDGGKPACPDDLPSLCAVALSAQLNLWRSVRLIERCLGSDGYDEWTDGIPDLVQQFVSGMPDDDDIESARDRLAACILKLKQGD